MASCKDCLHFEVCEARITADENYPERKYTENNNCCNFKDHVREALTDYLKKLEQLPRINKGHILKQAINTYGEDAQVDMAIEEMSELTKALLKQRRAVKNSDDVRILTTKCDIVEEIADVAIMLKQLLMMYDRNNEVQKQVDFKIDRLGERLCKHTEEK